MASILPSEGNQYFVDEKGGGRQRLRRQPISASELPGRAISQRHGVSEHVDALVLQIHEPGFLDAGPRIERDFDVSIVFEGRIRDFDHEDDITRRGMRGRIEVGSCSQYRKIRLRFGVRVEPHGTLSSDNPLPGKRLVQQDVQPVHTRRVMAADRRHLDDLAVDQLHAVVVAKDAGLRHAVIFVRCESPPLQFSPHVRDPPADPDVDDDLSLLKEPGRGLRAPNARFSILRSDDTQYFVDEEGGGRQRLRVSRSRCRKVFFAFDPREHRSIRAADAGAEP